MESPVVVENQCSIERVADIFHPVIVDVVAVYQAIFKASILNIRLQGSVARGEFTPHSDIDFIAVVNTTPSEEQMQKLEKEERLLCQKHSFISKIDMEAVTVEGLKEFRRFIFAIDSVSLFGSDTYTAQSQTLDRQKLIELVTPDRGQIVKSYLSGVEKTEENDERTLFFYSRLIGKDILKCLRRISLLNGGQYERNIEKIYLQLLDYAAENRELLDDLFALYAYPSSDKHRLLSVLYRVPEI